MSRIGNASVSKTEISSGKTIWGTIKKPVISESGDIRALKSMVSPVGNENVRPAWWAMKPIANPQEMSGDWTQSSNSGRCREDC